MKECRVMIAGGDPEVVAALRLLLARHPDFEVVGQSTTVHDLLRQTGDLRPDVIVLDCELRDLDVDTHLAQLRLLDCTVEIVALSTRDERRSQALEAGASAFVSKGESPPHLLEALRRVARRLDSCGDARMTFGQIQVRPGMQVVDTRGSAVGRVASVEQEQFVIDRGDGRTTTVPYIGVRSILGDQLVLDTGPELDTDTAP